MRATLALLLLFTVRPLQAAGTAIPRFTDPARRAKLAAAFPELDKVFESFRSERGIPGLVFGVVVDGDLAYVKGLGVRDLKTKDPVTPDTVFRIASMTKSFTALAIMKLRDEGKLSLDDPVSKWIPELAHLAYPTRDTPPITIRLLLTHGAGFPEDNPWGDRQLATSEEGMSRRLAAGLPFSTAPGTAYEYSNFGFAILGRIVAKASAVPYLEFMQKEILTPLHMTASGFEPAVIPASVRATGYRRPGETLEEEPSLPHGAFGAMGGLLTSARDLARHVANFLSAFPARDDKEGGPVRRSSLREMQHPWRPAGFSVTRPSPDAPLNAAASSYGYGLRIGQDCRFGLAVAHGGGLPGFGSYMLWLPDYGVGMFAMANLTYAGPAAPIEQALAILSKTGALKPRQLPPSSDLVRVRDAIVALWERWDDKEAQALAADNLFQDASAADRRKEIETLKSNLGICRATGEIAPLNLLRGSFRMNCERGEVEASFTLAPTMPPKVQALRFVSIKSLDNQSRGAVERLASLVESFREELLPPVAGSMDTAKLRAQFDALRVSYGACRVGETLAGDGANDIRVRWQCDRGVLDVAVRFDADGRLHSIQFVKPPGIPCIP